MATNATIIEVMSSGASTGTILGGVAVALVGTVATFIGARFFGGKYCSRKPQPVTCRHCNKEITECPHCGGDMAPEVGSPMEEKLRELTSPEAMVGHLAKLSKDPKAFMREMQTMATAQAKEALANPEQAMNKLRPVSRPRGAEAPVRSRGASPDAESAPPARSRSTTPLPPRGVVQVETVEDDDDITPHAPVARSGSVMRPKRRSLETPESGTGTPVNTTTLEVNADELQEVMKILAEKKRKAAVDI